MNKIICVIAVLVVLTFLWFGLIAIYNEDCKDVAKETMKSNQTDGVLSSSRYGPGGDDSNVIWLDVPSNYKRKGFETIGVADSLGNLREYRAMKLSNSDFTVRIQYNDLSSWNGWPRYHGEYLNIQVTLTCEEKTNSFLKAECFVPEKPGREYFSSEGKQLKALYWLKDAYASSSPEQRKIIFQRYITVLSDFARPYGNLALSDNSRSIWAEELNKVWVDNPDTINETAKLMEPNATCPKYTLYWVRGEPASYDAIMECAKKANEKISYNLLQKSGISPPAMQAKALEIADGINLSYSSDAWKLAEEWYRLAGLTPEQAQKRAVGKVLKGYCKQDRESVSLAINCAYWDVVAGKSKAEARQDAIKTLERIIVKSENERDKDSRLSNDDRKEAWTYLAENDPVNGASYKARLELSYPDSK